MSEALKQLQGTQIKTTIEAGGESKEGFFSWFSEARLHYSKTRTGEKRLKALKVRLCDWLCRSILRDRQVLDYASAYFQLGPIERRIYEVARSSCEGGGMLGDGSKPTVEGCLEVDLSTFRMQIECQNPLPNFRAAIKAIAGIDAILGHDVKLVEGPDTLVADEAPVNSGRRRRAAPASIVITWRRNAGRARAGTAPHGD